MVPPKVIDFLPMNTSNICINMIIKFNFFFFFKFLLKNCFPFYLSLSFTSSSFKATLNSVYVLTQCFNYVLIKTIMVMVSLFLNHKDHCQRWILKFCQVSYRLCTYISLHFSFSIFNSSRFMLAQSIVIPNYRGHIVIFMLLLVNGVVSIAHKSQIFHLPEASCL